MKRLMSLVALVVIAITASAQIKISGTLRDADGNGIAGVTVSDGFSCVTTDAKGNYRLNASTDAMHVFYSIPSAYKVNVKDGHPDFYKKIVKGVKRYDFTLTKNPTEEKAFRLLMV